MKKPLPEALLLRMAERFAALGDPTRLHLLQRLMAREATVGSLSAEMQLGQPSISKHLSRLRLAGMLNCRRDGTQMWYSVRDATLATLCEMMCGAIKRQTSEDAARVHQDVAVVVSQSTAKQGATNQAVTKQAATKKPVKTKPKAPTPST